MVMGWKTAERVQVSVHPWELVGYPAGDGSPLELSQSAPLEERHGADCWKRVVDTHDYFSEGIEYCRAI